MSYHKDVVSAHDPNSRKATLRLGSCHHCDSWSWELKYAAAHGSPFLKCQGCGRVRNCPDWYYKIVKDAA